MQVGNLFDLINSANGLIDLFEGVETTEQVVSRCERLKRGRLPEELLDAVHSLRTSVETLLNDTLDMHSLPDDLDDDDNDDESPISDPELDALVGEGTIPETSEPQESVAPPQAVAPEEKAPDTSAP